MKVATDMEKQTLDEFLNTLYIKEIVEAHGSIRC